MPVKNTETKIWTQAEQVLLCLQLQLTWQVLITYGFQKFRRGAKVDVHVKNRVADSPYKK